MARGGGVAQHGLDAGHVGRGRQQRDTHPAGGDELARQLHERADVAEGEEGEHHDVHAVDCHPLPLSSAGSIDVVCL